MKFYGSVLFLALQAGQGRSENAETSLRSSNRRRLAYEWIAGYEPRTLVTDHAAIDLDQAEIENLLEYRRLDAFRQIYEKGGHSQSIARVTIGGDSTIPILPIPKSTIVIGRNDKGDVIRGRLVDEVSWTSDDKDVTILVEYDASAEQANYVGCQVGGLVKVVNATLATDGCFETNGTIQILDLQKDAPAYHFTYSYDEKEDNFNGRTIQKFSTNAEEDMWKCLDCPMAEYSKFVKYYNAYDYGDQFIQAALNSEATNFTHGNADFTDHGRASRVEALVVATKFMNIYMYVIRMLEHGLNQCRLVCGKRCDDSPVRAWDQAVAYYTGSLEGESGSGSGLLMYDLADRMCVVFRTCGDDATLDYGTSYVNNKIMEEFAKGQAHLLKRECDDVVESKERIVKLMAVPLIQATLFAAYFQSAFPAVEKDDMAIFRVEGATYAASVLPLVHHCHPQDALAIHDNLRVERAVDWNDEANSEVDFLAVKDAFEHSYNCMGVTCDSVGGIWVDKAYSPDAAPCRGAADQNDGASPGGIFAIVVFSVVFVFSLSLVAMYRYHNGRDRNFVEEPVENLHVEDVVVDSQGFD